MPKIPYKPEKNEEEDEDYEIVSFEDFCDKSPTANVDLLTLNDNINYRLYYEGGKDPEVGSGEPAGPSGSIETSLDAPKSNSHQRKRPFAPFGKSDKNRRGSLFSGVIPKPKNEGDNHREHRYERFSQRRGNCNQLWDQIGSLLPGMLVAGLLCALGVATWWAVAGALAGGWGDDHYRRLWERVHPEEVKKPLTPLTLEKPVLTEYRYHDHNNLSTKNRGNLTTNKKDVKKAFMERSPEVMKELCARIVNDNMRFDCYPQDGANEEACMKRGCCWKAASTQNAPYCFYPPQYESYQFTNSTENKHGMSVYYTRSFDTGYPAQFAVARIDFNYLSDDILQVKITDAENKRFEPPYPEVPMVFSPILNMKYRVQVDSSVVGFKVIRNADNVTIWDAQNVGGLILSDKFLQISAVLPTNYTYGIGEKQARFLNDMNWQVHTLFNNDEPPTENLNLYGTHPFYLALETNGNSHGVFLLNSNAMDVVLQPTPAITYRTIGGILNFYIMLGPSPQQVISQYTEVIGKPFMPPYWSLGFHLCKFDYGSLNVTREVWQSNRDAEIPFDVQWNDLDYMNGHKDFTYDPVQFAGLPQFVRQLHAVGMRYVVLFDPGVSASEKAGEYPPYDRGVEMNVFVTNSTDQPFIGMVWNYNATVWPDFTHPNSTPYWKEMFADFHKQIPFDGAWIDMNEPSNFVSGSLHGSCLPEQLPYKPRQIGGEGLRHKTLCMEARHYAGPHYDLHNVYGLSETVATHAAMTEVVGKRSLIISRSSFPGTGHYAGHWSGDVNSRWHDMRASIPQLLSMSLFGIPMMGVDICGFNGDTTPELCKRWMQLGAYYPFSRNHNSDRSKPQDPVSMGEAVVSASRAALRLRYALLPVYYTLFWRASVLGHTVARPLFFSFPTNEKVYDIDDQFMIGDHLMIAGIMHEGANTTRVYYPGPNAWYNVRDGSLLAIDSWKTIGDDEMVAVKGGAILPLQEVNARGPVSTGNTRSRPLQLVAAPDRAGVASGELYWDDGESLNSYEEKKYSYIVFKMKDNELFSTIHWWGYGVPSINTIQIYTQKYPVNTLTINNVSTKFTQDAQTRVLTVPDLSLALDKAFHVKWTYKKMVPKI